MNISLAYFKLTVMERAMKLAKTKVSVSMMVENDLLKEIDTRAAQAGETRTAAFSRFAAAGMKVTDTNTQALDLLNLTRSAILLFKKDIESVHSDVKLIKTACRIDEADTPLVN